MIKNQKIKILFIVLLFITGIVLFIIGLMGDSENQTAPEPIYKDTPAVFSGNYSEIISNLSVTAFNLLRDDIKVLAIESVEEYKNLSTEVIFHVSEVIVNDSAEPKKVTVTGYFEIDKDSVVKINIDLLPNERIRITIDQSYANFDTSKLPSNSARNKFITNLPVQRSDYDIEYDLDSDRFILRLYELESQENAVEYIYSEINDPNFTEKIEIIPLGSNNFERFENIYPNYGAEVVTD